MRKPELDTTVIEEKQIMNQIFKQNIDRFIEEDCSDSPRMPSRPVIKYFYSF